MFSLFGLSRTMQGLLNRRDSKIASLVSLAAVAVRAMNEHSCSRDLNSWRLANHSESCILLGFGLSPRKKFQQVNFFCTSLSHSISQIKQWLLEKCCDNIDTVLYGSFHRKICTNPWHNTSYPVPLFFDQLMMWCINLSSNLKKTSNW